MAQRVGILLDALACIGDGGTQKNALRLRQAGLRVLPQPKTIDNDIACTDTSFGFSTVAVAEGAQSREDAEHIHRLLRRKARATSKRDRQAISEQQQKVRATHVNHTIHLTQQLERLTGLESRLTILGPLQRGGTPSAADRVLALWLGTTCVCALAEGRDGVMLAVQGWRIVPVPLESVAGQKKLVPRDHPLIAAARQVGAGFGD